MDEKRKKVIELGMSVYKETRQPVRHQRDTRRGDVLYQFGKSNRGHTPH